MSGTYWPRVLEIVLLISVEYVWNMYEEYKFIYIHYVLIFNQQFLHDVSAI